MSTGIIFLILIFFNFIIFLNFSKIARFINIYDYPDKIRKFHKKPVSILGGTIILFSLIIIFISIYFFNNNYFLYFGFDNKSTLVFFIFSIIIFFIYLFDDIKNINPNYKLLVLFFLIFLYLLLDSNVIIKNLRFSFYNTTIHLNKFSIPFTLICFLLFINALNMFDGINLQCGSYCLFIFIFLFFLTKNFSILFFVIPLILFLILNYLNVCFLGNTGSALLAFLISVLIIKIYNSGFVYADDIFLLMCIPGYDLLRLTFVRLINKQHPFYPDRNHLHHLISEKYGSFVALFLLLFLIISINVINFFFKVSTLLLIFLSIFFYSFIILYFKNKK